MKKKPSFVDHFRTSDVKPLRKQHLVGSEVLNIVPAGSLEAFMEDDVLCHKSGGLLNQCAASTQTTSRSNQLVMGNVT